MDFVSNLTGTLVRVEEDENSRFRYEIWFDYTRQAINQIREGAMLAVPNFASNGPEQHLSILELVTVLPMHYALGDARDLKGFPGFVVEAAKSIVNDWEDQESEATEDTTKIRCVAIPTNLEVVQSGSAIIDEPNLSEESNLPMLGANVRVLNTAFTNFVANNGIRDEENTLIAGNLIRDAGVEIKVRVEDLLKTHFGIFGFTGAGKSNLLSLIIDKILTSSSENVKLVFFDLMGEYNTLLIDQLVNLPDSMWISLGEETLPDSVLRYATAPSDQTLDTAVRDLINTNLMPRALVNERSRLDVPLRTLLQQNKIKYWRDRVLSISEFIEQIRSEVTKGNLGGSRQLVFDLVNKFHTDGQNRQFTDEAVNSMIAEVDTAKDGATTNPARECLDLLRQKLNVEGRRFAAMRPLPPNVSITIPRLIERLNADDSSGLYIVQAHDPDQLRNFAWMLGNYTYESRRRSGQITPMVSFVFDEADEFIPQNAQGTYAQSSDVAMTLARRGRKFGMGIGIATQRITYLNTSILAQPHTYFVSKLPRKSDRERVADAFGVSEDMFRQTFKFKKGDWLLMSYDATGLEAIPLPVHCSDANERIRAFLNTE